MKLRTRQGVRLPLKVILRNLDEALGKRELRRAINFAEALDEIDLDRAQALTVLMGEMGDRRYAATTKRLFELYVDRLGPPLPDDLVDLRMQLEATAVERKPLC